MLVGLWSLHKDLLTQIPVVETFIPDYDLY